MQSVDLSNALKALPLFSEEALAANSWASAFHVYFEGATAGVVGPVVPAGLTACEAAMAGALMGFSQPGQGALKIQLGIVAYWGAIVPAVAWPGCLVITPPPGLTGLTAALEAVFLANTIGLVGKDPAYDAIAGAIHAVCIAGGVAIFPIPIGVQPIL